MNDTLLEKLQSNLLFSNININLFADLLSYKKTLSFKEGSIIFSKGSDSDAIYLIIKGKVNYINYNFIDRGNATKGNILLQKNQFFGYEEMFEKRKRTSTAIAVQNTELLLLTEKDLELLISKSVKILENLSLDLFAQTKLVDANQQIPVVTSEYNFYKTTSTDLHKTNPSIQTKKEKIDFNENEILEMKLALEREKSFAEEAIKQEMEEINKKEEELKKLEEALNKEKEVSALSLSKEVEELQKKEDAVKNLEIKIAAQKEKAKQDIQKKLGLIKQKEEEIEKKERAIQLERKVLNEAMEKAKLLAQKEIELMKLSKDLENSKAKVESILSKENELKLKEEELSKKFAELESEKMAMDARRKEELELVEAELRQKFEELEDEKNNFKSAQASLEQLAQKEKEINEKALALEKEKVFSEEMLQKEFQQLEEREKLISQKEKELLEKENLILQAKEKEKELEQREKELEKKFEMINKEEYDFSSLLKKEEELKKKEIELREKELSLEKEKSFAETTLQEELKSVEQKENEVKRIAEQVEQDKQKLEKELRLKLAQLQAKESELFLKEEELNKMMSESKKIAKEEIARREREIMDERNSIRNQSVEAIKKVEEQLNEFKMRESVLLKRIESLEEERRNILSEKKSHQKESFLHADSQSISEPFYTGNQYETDIVSKSDIIIKGNPKKSLDVSPAFSDDDIVYIFDDGDRVIRREFDKTYQEFDINDIKVVIVNLQRGTTNYATEMQAYLNELIKAGHRKFIIDLSFCLFFDSTFLGVLVRNLKIINYEGGDLGLVLNTKKMASTTFFLAGMDRIFKIFDSIESALSIFKKKD
jgi:anti-anti-sigma factor